MAQHDGASLLRAKRLFFLNLALAGCLVTIGLFVFTDATEPVDAPSSAQTPLPPQEALNLLEVAQIKGQMLALSEHPDLIQRYPPDRLMKFAQQTILDEPLFKDLGASETDRLSHAFAEAYTQHFDDYFDDSAAKHFGYRHGLKYDPLIFGGIPPQMYPNLEAHRAQLEEKFNLDNEAKWQLFCKAFMRAFSNGYGKVQKGITKTTFQDNIQLIEDE